MTATGTAYRVKLEMPKGYPRTACKGCHRPVAECGSLSARGLCELCGQSRREANLACLVLRQGPYFDHWKRRTYMAALRLVLDDNRTER